MAFRATFVKNIIHFATQRGAREADLLQAVNCRQMEELNDENCFLP